jgi:osmotically-inducible protein OsmY
MVKSKLSSSFCKAILFGWIVGVFLIISACSSSSVSESTGEYFDSAAVTAKVKGRLVDMLGAKNALSIKVKTYKDNVQLSGFVNNATIKQRAGIIADNTLGVKTVRNNLIIK